MKEHKDLQPSINRQPVPLASNRLHFGKQPVLSIVVIGSKAEGCDICMLGIEEATFYWVLRVFMLSLVTLTLSPTPWFFPPKQLFISRWGLKLKYPLQSLAINGNFSPPLKSGVSGKEVAWDSGAWLYVATCPVTGEKCKHPNPSTWWVVDRTRGSFTLLVAAPVLTLQLRRQILWESDSLLSLEAPFSIKAIPGTTHRLCHIICPFCHICPRQGIKGRWDAGPEEWTWADC